MAKKIAKKKVEQGLDFKKIEDDFNHGTMVGYRRFDKMAKIAFVVFVLFVIFAGFVIVSLKYF